MMHKRFIQVDSSNIDGYLYLEKRMLLFIAFKGGGTYVYMNVDASKARSFANAASIGSFFHSQIKDCHTWKKLDDDDLEFMLSKESARAHSRQSGMVASELLQRYPILGGIF